MKKTMTKIFALVLVCAMLIGFVAMIPAYAAENDSVQIVGHNVLFDDYLQIMYALDVPAGQTVERIKLTDGNGNEFEAVPHKDKDGNDIPAPIGGVKYPAYVATTGVSLQNIDTTVTAEVYVKGENEPVVTDTYSVLEYLHKRTTVDRAAVLADVEHNGPAKIAMYESLLATAEKMQVVVNGGVTMYNSSYVCVKNGTIDGINADGMIKVDEDMPDLTCDQSPVGNQEIVWTVTEYTNGVAGSPYDLSDADAKALKIQKGVNLFLEASLQEADAPTTTEIVFEMGEDGNATHSDGSNDTATYSETVDGYTLSLTGGSKMYPNARDAKGNGAIKLGTGSIAGTFTTTVPNDVTKVILYVAGYKDDPAKIKINGGEVQTISTISDNGEYTAVEIDTTTNKTITFTTASGGYRAMLNTVKFVVMVCNHNSTTAVEAKAATCTEIGYEENTVFCNDCQCYISGGEIAATGHQNTVNTEVVAPTCVAVGTHNVFCNDCQTTIQTGVTTPATNVHTFVDGVCTGCGESEGTAAEPTTVSMNIFGTTGVMASGNGSISWTSTDGNVTFTNIKGGTAIRATDNNHYRCYANSKVKIEATGMTQIVIYCQSGYADDFENAIKNAGYTYKISGNNITITLDSVDAIEFTLGAQARLTKIEVTYTK